VRRPPGGRPRAARPPSARRAGPPDGPARYLVVVADSVVGEADAYGPMPRTAAQRYAARIGVDLDDHGISGVTVTVVALTTSAVTEPDTAAPSGT
jgi:hypothetical protein